VDFIEKLLKRGLKWGYFSFCWISFRDFFEAIKLGCEAGKTFCRILTALFI
jgi:hypothetical protein